MAVMVAINPLVAHWSTRMAYCTKNGSTSRRLCKVVLARLELNLIHFPSRQQAMGKAMTLRVLAAPAPRRASP
jgi:hypothetical protein